MIDTRIYADLASGKITIDPTYGDTPSMGGDIDQSTPVLLASIAASLQRIAAALEASPRPEADDPEPVCFGCFARSATYGGGGSFFLVTGCPEHDPDAGGKLPKFTSAYKLVRRTLQEPREDVR